MLASLFTYWLRAVRLPAAPAAATTTAATIATAAVLARLRLVHRQRAALQLGAVQRDDRRLRLRLVRHLDEAEAAGAARVAVRRYARARNRAVRRESGLEVAFARVKTKISNVNVQVVLLSLLAPVGAYGYRCQITRTINEVPGNVKRDIRRVRGGKGQVVGGVSDRLRAGNPRSPLHHTTPSRAPHVPP